MSGVELSFDDFDDLVNIAITHIYRDNECWALQKIIKKQQKEIEELQKKYNNMISFNNDLLIQNKNSISKDKISEIIKLTQNREIVKLPNNETICASDCYELLNYLQELLEENKSNENNI